jgi:hypothetical protein
MFQAIDKSSSKRSSVASAQTAPLGMIRREKFFRSSQHWTTVLNFVRLRSADVEPCRKSIRVKHKGIGNILPGKEQIMRTDRLGWQCSEGRSTL